MFGKVVRLAYGLETLPSVAAIYAGEMSKLVLKLFS